MEANNPYSNNFSCAGYISMNPHYNPQGCFSFIYPCRGNVFNVISMSIL
ncbi:hypothetical protein NC652_026590 [Populus alba x Populus x berolinensis]|nr:hypothetical protein NC652_026590 [Populus alba x Populus x berolinensis]